ncbi:MAG TPA: ferritin family protein [Thermoanaerobaculia bacterium]
MKGARRPFLILLSLTLLFGTVAVLAQGQDDIAGLVQQAIANERNAQARYAAFAAKADEEGFGGVASLFRACGKAETVHEEKFVALLKKLGGTEPEGTEEPKVGTTRENIAACLAAEQSERDTFYHDAYEKAQAAGKTETAKAFDRARTAESEHANLLMAANWSVNSMKEKRTYFVCSGCGFTSETKLPRGCPLCAGQGKLVPVN